MDEQYSDLQQLSWSEVPLDIRILEVDMFTDLSKQLCPGHPDWQIFCRYLDACVPYFSQETMRSGFLEVGKELRAKGHIETGCYGHLKYCLKEMPDPRKTVEKYENKIRDKWREYAGNSRGNIAVNVFSRSPRIQEGQTVALLCSVNPQASSITWMKGMPEPMEDIFIDNMKYIAGNPWSPSLVIVNTDKSSDESNYCLIATGSDQRNQKKSGIIHLVVEEKTQDHTAMSFTKNVSDRNTDALFRKRSISEVTSDIGTESDEPRTQRPRKDSDTNVSFPIENNIDISRQQSKEDIRKVLETNTQEQGRMDSPEFVEQCILVSVDIKGASSPTEPSALCLAERVKAFLRKGGIRLTDDANTKLKIKTDDIRIAIKHQTTDGCPVVSISQAEYYADEGIVFVMHCTVLASPPATSVRWVRIRYGEEEELDIDNDKYLGGGVLSPSLIITDVSYTDEGYYRCYVTNSESEGKSNTAWLETNSDYTDLSTFLHQNGHDRVDSGAVKCIKSYLQSSKTSVDDISLLRMAIVNDSKDLLRYIISTEPDVLSNREVDGCDVLHYCCQYGQLPLFKLLIESGMNVEGKTSNGSTCLMMATLNRSSQILQYLIENYPEQLNVANSDGMNCLLMSCVRDNIHIFDLLVKTEVSLEHKDKAGNTCLMTAILKNNNCLARFIAANYPKQLCNNDGLNALRLCCREGNIEMFKFLIVTWKDPPPIFENGITCLMVGAMHNHFELTRHIVDKYPEQLDQRTTNNFDVLLYCCEGGDVKIFDYLIGAGVKPDTRSSDGSTCLMFAARNKHFELTRHIMDKYPEQLDQRTTNNFDVLLYCCEGGDVKIFDYLIGAGVKPDTRSSDGSTCLMFAARNKHFELTRHIMDKYPEQLAQRNKNELDVLLASCQGGDVKIFDYLVGAGVKPDTSTSNGLTCLMIAALNKQFELTRHIMEIYPEQLEQRNKNGFDALICCCEGGDVKIFDYLIGAGVKPDTRSSDGSTCLMYAARNKHFELTRHIMEIYREQLEQRNMNGSDVLLYCCEGGDVKIFDYLIGSGVKPDTRSSDGSTCLMYAARKKHFELARHIMEIYPEQLEQRNKNGFDALLASCQGGDVKIFDYLIDVGVKPDTRSSDGSTCLMIAALNKHFEFTRHIMEIYPEQLEQRNKNGFDALLASCQGGDVKIFDYLIDVGVKPDTSTSNGLTCVMIAALNKHFELTRHIMEIYPEQLEQRNKNGFDALLFCCEGGDVKIFDYLIGAGVKPDTRSSHGSTCLMVAAWNKHFELTRHIMDKYPEKLAQRNKNELDVLLASCQGGDVKIFDYLIDAGVKPDTRSSDGSTCLMIAAWNKHFELTRHIMDKYPEQLEQRDKNEFDVLLASCQSGDVKIFDYLVGAGVKSDTRSSDGSTCLMIAARNKHFELTRHIMEIYPEQLEQRNKNGFDVLLYCCEGGDVKIFDYLIDAGVKPDTRSSDGSTCLMIAAWNKHFELTRHIMDKYPEQLEQRDKNEFDVLLASCQSGDVKIFDYLVGAGVKSDTRSSDGSTCLMIAARNKHFELTRHIMEIYPEQLEQRNKNGFDVLLYCCEGGDVKIFDYLIGEGVKPDTRSSDGSTCLMYAARNKHFELTRHIMEIYPEQLEQRNKNGFDALLASCQVGDVKIFDYLIGVGVKPDTSTSNGLTCLMIAALNKHFELTRHIMEIYPEQLEQRNKNGFDALLASCQGGDVKIFDYLIGAGVKPDTRSSDRSTCLMIAAWKKHFELTRHIMEIYPEQLEQRNQNGFDALLASCQGGDVKIFDYLTDVGVKPDTSTSNGLTCLMIAALNKHFELTRHIMEIYPEQLKQRNKNGFDALICCCEGGDVKIFDYLIGAGVKPDTRSSDGSTCLMFAARNKHFELTRRIMKIYPEQLEQRNKNGFDVLICCCHGGDVKIFDYLVGEGAKPGTRFSDGLTCLMVAALKKHFELTRHIIHTYPEQLEQRDKTGFNVLLVSCQVGDVKIFDYLIGAGVKLDTRSSDGSTCLMIAARNKHFELTRHIMEKYPEQLEQRNKNGFDALLCCCQGGDVKIFDYLIGVGVKPDTRSSDGLTCLMIAAQNKHFELTRHIIYKYPEQLKQRNKNGLNVLLASCQGGDVKIFDYLIGAGVKPDKSTSDRSTCLMIADQNKHFELTRHIINKYPEQLE